MLNRNQAFYYCIVIGLFSVYYTDLSSQQFNNGDLEGPIDFLSSLPPGWDNVPYNSVICLANQNGPDTPDLCNEMEPLPIDGINGNPQSGLTFMSGTFGGSLSGGAFFDEGIQQTVSGFSIGETYQIDFFQTVVKESYAIDDSGAWAVFVDDVQVGITAVSIAPGVPYDSNSLVWDQRSITFAATSGSHMISFLPRDDDLNSTVSSTDVFGALRMGIDNISFFDSSIDMILTLNDATICQGDCVTLEINSNVQLVNFEWNEGITLNQGSIEVCPMASTAYSVFVTGANGDTATVNANVVVLESPFVDLGTDVSICSGSVLLDAGVSGQTYLWQDNTNTQYYEAEESGFFSVTVSNGQCSSTDEIEVMIDNLEVDFVVTNNEGCFPLSTNFWNDSFSSSSDVGWNWSLGDGTSSTEENPSHIYSESGSYEITLEVVTAIGCTAIFMEDINVDISEAPIADFSVLDVDVDLFQEITFDDNSSNGLDWSWDFGNGMTSSEQNPIVAFNEGGDFPITLTVWNNECFDEVEVIIHVKEYLHLYVPNSFTPNEDGINDLFFPVITGAEENSYVFKVFSRNGDIVFESTNLQDKWDGASNASSGHYTPNGIYNWRIQVTERATAARKLFQGFIQISR